MTKSTFSQLSSQKLLNPGYWRRAPGKFWDKITDAMPTESALDTEIPHLWYPWPGDRAQGPASGLTILYVAPRFDYGIRARGLSYEENNFLHPLLAMGNHIIRFDYPTILAKYGKSGMNQMLLETVYRYQPDAAFFVLFQEEIEQQTLKEMQQLGRTVTLNWFADDHWRFDSFSRHWAPCFDWVVTTTQGAFERYHDAGIHNVVLSQWAANHRLYYPMRVEKKYDVTFIGQPHGDRREVIERLRNEGIRVATWGHGWETGKLTQLEMVRVFSQTKINLNFANASVPGVVQIKGRNFEVPACRACLLTGYVPELENYYEIGTEVVCFTGYDELRDKIRYYLEHDEERENIAERGYQRTLAQHTFDARFHDIFRKAGLAHGDAQRHKESVDK